MLQSWPLSIIKVGECFKFPGKDTIWKVSSDDGLSVFIHPLNCDYQLHEIPFEIADNYRVFPHTIKLNGSIRRY